MDERADQENLPEEPANSARTDMPAEGHRLGISGRFSAWLRESHILPQKRKPSVEEEIAPLEDGQVTQRLIGEAVPEATKAKPAFVFKPRRRTRSRAVVQPEPEPQKDAGLNTARVSLSEIAEPDLEDLRTTAMQGYTAVAPAEFEKEQPAFTRLLAWFDRLSLLQKMTLLLGTLVTLGLIIFLIVISSPRSPSPVASGGSNISNPNVYLNPSAPIPTSVVFPDNQKFELGLGTVTNGSWTPKGAEWLVGTEVPRWLALPWTASLESAVRAFKVNGPIQLLMSNGDDVVYRFQSMQELSTEEMGSFHTNTMDLLIVLSRPGNATHLVILAVP